MNSTYLAKFNLTPSKTLKGTFLLSILAQIISTANLVEVSIMPSKTLDSLVQVCLIGVRAELCRTVALQEQD